MVYEARPEEDQELPPTYKVQLKDGVEVGPLDVQMLQSWYEQGMVGRDSLVRPSGQKKWVPLVKAVDISGWGASVATRGGVRSEASEEAGEAEAPQRWRAYLASVVLLVAGGAAGYVLFLPERVLPSLRSAPWREISLGLVGLALLMAAERESLRKVSRILLCALTFSLFPLAAFFIVPVVQAQALVVLFSAWVMGSGLFFFLAGRRLPWTSVVLSLLWVIAGAAGVVYFGFVPSTAVATAPAPAPAAVAVTAPAGPSAAALALREEVPLLSVRAAEAVLAGGAAAPDQGLKIAYASASRGLGVLAPAEAEELGVLTAATYEALSAADRTRVLAYLDRARKGEATPLEDDRAVTALMRDAVLKLEPPRRERLQALFEKAITAGR